MFQWKVGLTVIALAAVALVAPRPAAADDDQINTVTTVPTIAVDEFGNGRGTVGGGYFSNDPGPGGLNHVLTYNLPFAGTPGDIYLTDADAGNAVLDVLRFNGNGTLLFYSDNVGGADSPGDTDSGPHGTYQNTISIPEVGTEGQNGAIYTATDGHPGSVPGAVVTYEFVSDGVVPEPASLGLLLTGGLPLFGFLRRRRA